MLRYQCIVVGHRELLECLEWIFTALHVLHLNSQITYIA